MANDKIVIRGAREHNLKDINLTIAIFDKSLYIISHWLKMLNTKAG